MTRALAPLLPTLLSLTLLGCTSQRSYWVPIANNPRQAETLTCEAQCKTTSEEGSDRYYDCLEACPNVRVIEAACEPGSARGHCHQKSVSHVAAGVLLGLGVVVILIGAAAISGPNVINWKD